MENVGSMNTTFLGAFSCLMSCLHSKHRGTAPDVRVQPLRVGSACFGEGTTASHRHVLKSKVTVHTMSILPVVLRLGMTP